MKLLTKHLPNLPTWLSLAGLLISLALLAWDYTASSPYALTFPLALGLALLCLILLFYWAGWRMRKFSNRLAELWNQVQSHRALLQHQVAVGNKDLRLQREMLNALQEDRSLDKVMQLARELTGVTHASCWVGSFKEARQKPHIRCLKSIGEGKLPFEDGDCWYEEDYATFFQLLRQETPIVYPESHWRKNYRAPLGNLLHYIDDNQVKALLIVPIKTKNGATGIIWLEDRQQVRPWSERSVSQAAFIADLLHLEFAKLLRKKIIFELSDEAHRLDALRDAGATGWGWYALEQPMQTDLPPDLQAQRLAKATLEEGAPRFLAISKQPLGSAFGEVANAELIGELVGRNFTIDNRVFYIRERYIECDSIGVWRGDHLLGIWVSVQDVTEREEKNQEQERLIGKLASFSSILTEVDEENSIVFDSPSLRYLGYEPHERLGHGLPSYLHESSMEALELALWKARRHQTAQTCLDLRMRRLTGGYAFFDAQISPSDEDNGNVTVEFINASLRIGKEDELIAEKEFIEHVVAQGQEAIGVIGLDENFNFLSQNWGSLFGYESSERKGRYALEYFHRQYTPELSKALARIVEGEQEVHRQEAEFLPRTGKWMRVQVGLYALRSHDGFLEGVVFRMSPVSQQAKDIARLRNREALAQDMINADNRSYLLLGPSGKIRYGTENLARILGFSPKEVIGQPIYPLIRKEEQGAFAQNLEVWKLGEGNRQEAHFSVKHKNGSWKALHFIGLGTVKNEEYAGILLALEEPLSDDNPIDTQIELRADFFMGLANSLPFPVWFIDHAGQVKFTNEEAKSWLGFRPTGDMQSFMDSKSARTIREMDQDETRSVALRVKNHKGSYWQVYAMSCALSHSVVKGRLIMLPPPSAAQKELEAALEQAERKIESIKQQQNKAMAQKEGWEQELEKKRKAMAEMQKSHQEELEYQSNRMDLLNSALMSKNHEINSLETQLRSFSNLHKQGKKMQKHFEDLRELLFLFDGVGPETDWETKWREIQNFKKIINYQGALRFARNYLATLQEALDESDKALEG